MMYRARSREGSLLEERRSPRPYRVCSWPLGSPGCQITSLQSPALTLADTGQASAPSPTKACCHLKQIPRHRPPQHKKKPQHVLLYVAIVFSAHLQDEAKHAGMPEEKKKLSVAQEALITFLMLHVSHCFFCTNSVYYNVPVLIT